MQSPLFNFHVICVAVGKEMVMPGDDVSLTLTLGMEIPLELNQRFTLREGQKTVGTGVVTEILAGESGGTSGTQSAVHS